ncbi:MAG: SprT-like domain-containing protein [Bacteriovoracaceae bacterium]
MGAKFFRTRFLLNNYYYPLNFVVFEKEKLLAYFEPGTFRLGFNKKLMYEAKSDILKDILRHELAHYLTHIRFSDHEHAHGPEFHSVCERYGWGREVSDATIEIMKENEKIEGDLKTEDLMVKVKKLLTLAQSDNPHEAELATLKANQLILKHNLQYIADVNNDEEILYTARVYAAPRNSAKMQTVYEILRTFMVYPVFNYGKEEVYLEVSGSKTNVEIADYVAGFLERELEKLWEHNKEAHNLKGKVAKNSFFHGVGLGYKSKHQEFRSSVSSSDQKSLIKIEQDLVERVKAFYPRLSSVGSERQHDQEGLKRGHEAGKNLSIQAGIKGKLLKLLK